MIVSFLPATRVAVARAVEQPVVQNERPARYLLTGGGVVVGTKVGEDAEFFVVQTSSGVVRVRKTDIASIDFNTGGGGATPVATTGPAPAPAPPPPVDNRYPGPSRTGHKVFTAGLWTFVGVYLFVSILGALISTADPDANWMLVPVAGPMLYYQFGDLHREVFGILLLTTILEGAAFTTMIIGAAMGSGDAEASRGFHLADGVDLAPIVARDAGGLLLSMDW